MEMFTEYCFFVVFFPKWGSLVMKKTNRSLPTGEHISKRGHKSLSFWEMTSAST